MSVMILNALNINKQKEIILLQNEKKNQLMKFMIVICLIDLCLVYFFLFKILNSFKKMCFGYNFLMNMRIIFFA